mgnify:FL=1
MFAHHYYFIFSITLLSSTQILHLHVGARKALANSKFLRLIGG